MATRMNRRMLNAVGALAAGGAALVIAASSAFACAVLTNSTLNVSSGPPGTTVTLTGDHFGVAHGDVAQTFSPVEVRLDGLTGPLLASVAPTADGSISVPVTIPADAAPGYHVLLTIQRSATGTPVPGSPGRVLFQVGSSQASVASSAAAAGLVDASPAPASSSNGLSAVAIGLITVGGLLVLTAIATTVGAGVVEARREARRQPSKA